MNKAIPNYIRLSNGVLADRSKVVFHLLPTGKNRLRAADGTEYERTPNGNLVNLTKKKKKH